MPHLNKKFTIIADDFIRAGEVSIQIQSILKSIGFKPDVIRRASVCAYESEMNVVMHGDDGTFSLDIDEDLIRMEVRDQGDGIADIKLALQEGYSTARPEHIAQGFGAGMGLPNIKKNSDRLEIESKKGQGTCLKIYINVHDSNG